MFITDKNYSILFFKNLTNIVKVRKSVYLKKLNSQKWSEMNRFIKHCYKTGK